MLCDANTDKHFGVFFCSRDTLFLWTLSNAVLHILKTITGILTKNEEKH